MGEVLSEYDRSSFYLATKFPGYERGNFDKKEEIFEEQLRRCKTDYFDFDLLHTLTDENIEWYTDDEIGLVDYLLEQKKAGRIRHLGFSCHSSFETMHRLIKKYYPHLEFCQIQLNYLDFEFQDAKSKVEYLNNLGMPIWVMEGLRGGKLAKSALGGEKLLAKSNPDFTPANWAFAFLQAVPGVTMILSGMSNMEQLQQNIEFFAEKHEISDDDIATLLTAAHFDTQAKGTIPCTACRYCTSKCPQGLPIPDLFGEYNEIVYDDKTEIPRRALRFYPEDKWPNNCIGCGECAKVCPQRIDIPGMMTKMAGMITAE